MLILERIYQKRNLNQVRRKKVQNLKPGKIHYTQKVKKISSCRWPKEDLAERQETDHQKEDQTADMPKSQVITMMMTINSTKVKIKNRVIMLRMVNKEMDLLNKLPLRHRRPCLHRTTYEKFQAKWLIRRHLLRQ